MTGPVLQSVVFDAPLVNPSPTGLYPVTVWSDELAPLRWLDGGVIIHPHNYGGADAFGIWDAEWCPPSESQGGLSVEDIKIGDRPDIPDAFPPMVVWAYDQCDMTGPSQTEVRLTAQQVLRLEEQVAVETALAIRMLDDAPATSPTDNIVQAVADLEAALALTNTVGMIHAGAQWAAEAARFNLITRSGGVMRTPMGHTWVFGGGYVTGLGDTLVATSPTFGWRSDVQVRDTLETRTNEYIAIAERAVVVGYEQCVGAATTAVASV